MNELEKSLYSPETTDEAIAIDKMVYFAIFDGTATYFDSEDAYVVDGKFYRRNSDGLFAEVK